jgi:hypothetical protein
MIYRVMVLSTTSLNPAQPPAILQSGLSFCVFGLSTGYFLVYYIGVLARSRTQP